jgi:lipopolysaccharide/colanic/teichoic acid biosynthesis glycosyltransferase
VGPADVTRLRRLADQLRRPFAANLIALGGSMVALGIATLWVARTGGPTAVGDYALLRILPWLVAVIVSGGLAGSITFFLAGPTRQDPRIRSTIVAITLLSAAAGAVLWLLASPILQLVFFRHLSVALIAWVALRVVLRLLVITGKAAAQGSGDLMGSNLTILLEELMFLPAFGVMLAGRASGDTAIIGALLLADLASGALAWSRLLRGGFIAGAHRPSPALARQIYAFGLRGQVGSLMQLLNLRFNFILLGGLAGPAALGIYAVAAKYAEFLRVLPIAANWVLYPQFARSEAAQAKKSSRSLILRTGAVTAAASIPLAVAAAFVIPVLFGQVFAGAVLPARILLIGLAAEGVGGVVTAFLFGRGRPGLNSLAAGAGVLVTLIVDVILIPRYGAVGAAIASSVAYLTTTSMLVVWYWHTTKNIGLPSPAPVFDGMASVAPSMSRRILDIAASLIALAIAWPALLILLAAARISTNASAIYRQVRVGQGGVPFTMYKIRSMRPELGGPEITGPDDRRITKLGGLMRATSLDELPQLVNVLRGDMTLVGPRPETVALAQRYPIESREVFAHRPGMTGPVQVRLRDEVPLGVADVEDYYLKELLPMRTELDLAYVANPTMPATVSLLVETAAHVLTRGVAKIVASRRALRAVGELKGTTT